MKKIVILFSFLGAMFVQLHGKPIVPLVAIDGVNTDVKFSDLGRTKNLRFRRPSAKDPRLIVYSTTPATDKWELYVFSFVPDKDGEVLMEMRADSTARHGQISLVEYSEISQDGAELCKFRNDLNNSESYYMRVKFQQRTEKPAVLRVNGYYHAVVPLIVKKDQRVTIRFKARLSKPEIAPTIQEYRRAVPREKDYYLSYLRPTLLPLKDKGYHRLENHKWKKHKSPRKYAEFVVPPVKKDAEMLPLDASFEVLEEFGIARKNAPVRLGIPLAKGTFDLSKFALTDSNNKQIPAQFSVLSFYSDRSIRNVLVHFFADFKANESKTFRVIHTDKIQEFPKSTLGYTVKDGIYYIYTGKLRAEINSKKFSMLKNIRVNGKIIGSFSNSGIEFIDEFRKLHAASALPVKVTVEESGPERLVFKVSGDYGAGKISSFDMRIGFARNSTVVTVDYRHINTNTEMEFTDLKSLGFKFISRGTVKSLKMDEISANEITQLTDRAVRVDGKMNNDLRMSGAGKVETDKGNITFVVREMYQRFPKAVRISSKTVEFDMLPALPGKDFGKDLPHYLRFPFCEGFHRSKWGMAFSQKFEFDFSGEKTPAELAAEELVPVLDRDYISSTGVYEGVLPAKETAFDAIDKLFINGFYNHMATKETQREFGHFNYGDWYGERIINWTNNEYDMSHILFMAFLRTGNRDLYRWARIAARHHADVDIIHASANAAKVGVNAIHSIGHTGVGYQARWSWNGDYMQEALNGHTWSHGMTDAWTITGDAAAMDSVLLLGRNLVDHAVPNFKTLRRQSRTGGWCLIALMGVYKVTGDPIYLDAADKMYYNVIRKEQLFDKGACWANIPKNAPEKARNLPWLAGILTEGLRMYYKERPNPECKESLIAVAKWFMNSFDPKGKGWAYYVYWNCVPIGKTVPTMNSITIQGMLTGNRLIKDIQAFKNGQIALEYPLVTGFSPVGKMLALESGYLSSIYEEMWQFAKENNLKLELKKVPYTFPQDAFSVRYPTEKSFLVFLDQENVNLKFSRTATGSKRKTEENFTVKVVDPSGKSIFDAQGKTDSKKDEYTVELKGKKGDLFKILIHDDCRALWNFEDYTGFTPVSFVDTGYGFIGGPARRYFVVPKESRKVTFSLNNEVPTVVKNSAGEIIFDNRIPDLKKNPLPWVNYGKIAPYQEPPRCNTYSIERSSSDKDEIWEIHMYSRNWSYFSLKGAVPYITLKPFMLPEEFIQPYRKAE